MKNTKRGFTIVELVIVIAVIAILAAILIPVFSNVTDNAKDAAAKAEIKNAYSAFVADKALAADEYLEIDDYYYVDSEGTVYLSDGTNTGKVIDGTPTAAGTNNGFTLYVISSTSTKAAS